LLIFYLDAGPIPWTVNVPFTSEKKAIDYLSKVLFIPRDWIQEAYTATNQQYDDLDFEILLDYITANFSKLEDLPECVIPNPFQGLLNESVQLQTFGSLAFRGSRCKGAVTMIRRYLKLFATDLSRYYSRNILYSLFVHSLPSDELPVTVWDRVLRSTAESNAKPTIISPLAGPSFVMGLLSNAQSEHIFRFFTVMFPTASKHHTTPSLLSVIAQIVTCSGLCECTHIEGGTLCRICLLKQFRTQFFQNCFNELNRMTKPFYSQMLFDKRPPQESILTSFFPAIELAAFVLRPTNELADSLLQNSIFWSFCNQLVEGFLSDQFDSEVEYVATFFESILCTLYHVCSSAMKGIPPPYPCAMFMASVAKLNLKPVRNFTFSVNY
jgi:hypothetical protein